MSIADILILLAVSLLLVLAFVRTKKKGFTCGGNCSACAMRGECKENKDE